MATQKQKEEWQRADDEVRKNLPPGVKLLRTLRGHTDTIGRIAWSPDGRLIASPSDDNTVRLWEAKTGVSVHELRGHSQRVVCCAWHPGSEFLASGSKDKSIRLWSPQNGTCKRVIADIGGECWALSWAPCGGLLAAATFPGVVCIWDCNNGELVRVIERNAQCEALAWSPDGKLLAIASWDATIRLWDASTWRMVGVLSGHADHIYALAWSPDQGSARLASSGEDLNVHIWDVKSQRTEFVLEGSQGIGRGLAFFDGGQLLAMKSGDYGVGSIDIWRADLGTMLVSIAEPARRRWPSSLATHPFKPLLASVGSDLLTPEYECDQVIHIWQLDSTFLLGQPAAPSVSYTSAKVVLVGDSGVGKTGLGWRLANGEFKEHASTHGQQFWLLDELCQKRADGTECEAVLWDLAGQPDYRLIHALFLDDADLALVLFDPTRNDDPLAGVEFWLNQLKVGQPDQKGPLAVLVAARSDRGTPRLTQAELDAFCRQRGITAYHATSAMAGEGIEALVERMKGLIPWDRKPSTVTTETFKRIKDFVLELKELVDRGTVILTPEELRERLQATDQDWKFTPEEMLTAVGHLANHGYVTRLKTSQGDLRFLLAPELLNNLAASYVLEARREEKGLGSLKEEKLLACGYAFPELEKVTPDERAILLDSAAALFLEHNVCFRETDLLGNAYLVFPELINLKRPLDDDGQPVEDGVAYTASGAVENVYASLVVLMGYTQTFTRTNQWRNHARYEVGRGQVCGFRLEAERAGELDFVLYFAKDTPAPVRMLFQSLFENFMNRRNLTVHRIEPVVCKNGHVLDRVIVRKRSAAGESFAFCSDCGERTALPKADQPIHQTKQQAVAVDADRRAAEERSRFEQKLFQLKTHVTNQKLAVPECFISYAWGVPEHELWVERRLATDLQKAGVAVVLDRWENARIGASVPRFVEKAGKCDRVIVVGTPLYRKKYDNDEPMRSFVVAAEGDLIGKRMIGTEAKKESVLPLLLDGTEETAFPHLLHGRVYADFRQPEAYFTTMLDLLLSLFAIGPQEPVAKDLRQSLGRESS